jgi:hypothetical protein
MDRHAATDRVHLSVVRALIQADVCSPVDRLAVLRLVVERLAEQMERDRALARQEGVTYAAIGRALGVSRQAAREGERRRGR